MFILFAILFFAGALTVNVNCDYELIKKGIEIKHTQRALLKAIFALPTYILLLIPFKYSFLHGLFSLFITAGLLFSVWWELFDGSLNLKRGKTWRYNGSPILKKDDSKLDKVLRKLKSIQQAVSKLSLIAIFLLSYIIIKHVKF